LAASALTLLAGPARAALNVDLTDFIVCNGCSEEQRRGAAIAAVPSDGNDWTVVVWDENGSSINSYSVSREYDRELRREFSYAFAISNDPDTVETVQLVKQMKVNLDAARIPASAGMTWEENGIAMGAVPAGMLPIPVPPDVSGGPIGSASDVIGRPDAALVVANHLRRLALTGMIPPARPTVLKLLTRLFFKTEIVVPVIFADGSTMSFKFTSTFFSVSFLPLDETARNSQGDLLMGGSGGGSGGGESGGGGGGGSGLRIAYVCVSGTVTAGGFVSIDTLCFNTFVP